MSVFAHGRKLWPDKRACMRRTVSTWQRRALELFAPRYAEPNCRPMSVLNMMTKGLYKLVKLDAWKLPSLEDDAQFAKYKRTLVTYPRGWRVDTFLYDMRHQVTEEWLSGMVATTRWGARRRIDQWACVTARAFMGHSYPKWLRDGLPKIPAGEWPYTDWKQLYNEMQRDHTPSRQAVFRNYHVAHVLSGRGSRTMSVWLVRAANTR